MSCVMNGVGGKMREIKRKIDLDPVSYLRVVSLVLFSIGFVLFFYCLFFNINIGLVVMVSNPLFYLVLGFCCILFSFFVGKYGFLEVDS